MNVQESDAGSRCVRASLLLLVAALALLAGCLDGPSAVPSDATLPTAPADFSADVDEDLIGAGFDRTFSFDYAEGASGGFTVGLRTRMQGLIQPEACVQWTRTFEGGQVQGSTGQCSQGGGNLIVAIGGADLLDGERQVFHADGDDLRPGHYDIHVTAPAQANRIWVAGGIDNPPLDDDAFPGSGD